MGYAFPSRRSQRRILDQIEAGAFSSSSSGLGSGNGPSTASTSCRARYHSGSIQGFPSAKASKRDQAF